MRSNENFTKPYNTYIKGGKPMQYSGKGGKKLSVEDVLEFPILGMDVEVNGKNRHIRKETCQHFNTRTELDLEKGRPKAVYFEVTHDGLVKGFLRCNLFPENKHDKWSVIGDVDTHCDLLGANKVGSNKKKIFITEGGFDMLSVFQTLSENNDAKWKEFISVTSIGFGTANAVKHCANNKDFLSVYDEIVTVMDADRATPEEKRRGIKKGNEATGELHMMFGDCATYVQMKDGSDPSDYLQRGESKELYWALRKPVAFVHSGVTVGCPITIEELNTPSEKGIAVDFLPKLSNMINGFGRHQMTVLMSVPKIGKSTICRALMHSWKKAGRGVCAIMLEESLKTTVQGLMAIEANVPLSEFRKDPSLIKDEKKEKIITELFDDNMLMVSCDNGIPKPDELIEIVRYSCARLPPDSLVVLDHVSIIMSGDESKDERKKLDGVMTELASIVKMYPIHLIVISHVTVNKERGKVKGKDGKVVYPYWYHCEDTDTRSSSIFSQITHNLISMSKEVKADGSRGDIVFKLHLCRENGNSGFADMVNMSPSTGRLINKMYDFDDIT